ncbi:MAG TPA: TonB-dependent receptor [Longimicrobium sp.]|nr:TonB-dependent receptor [Longimicrobium sp.]
MRRPSVVRTLLLLVFTLLAAPLSAQETGAVAGTVRDVSGIAGLAGVRVEAVAADGRVAGRTTTDYEGNFRLEGLPAGRYTLVLSGETMETRRLEARVDAGRTATVTTAIAAGNIDLDPLVISASKRPEKATEAPARVEVVNQREIEERPAVTVADHVKAVPGVDVASNGLIQSNIVARGFNNVFSGALLMITDNRIAAVPSLRLNAPYMIPAANEDIERIEVVLGPAAALYGPNSANGVLHLITRSPFDSPGLQVSLAGGERNLVQGSARGAAVLSDRFAVKLSGQFLRGDDWEYTDPVEASARAAALPGDPNTVIGLRDPEVQTWKADARADWRMAEGADAIFSAGVTHVGNAVEMTGLGAAQAQDWRYTYGQARFRWNRLFAQAFANFSDAGDTYLLRTGQPIVDRSRIYVGQVQHGFALGDGRQNFTYGVDLQRTEPKTDSTILGRNEGVEVTELGAYLQSETRLSRKFDFVAAARVDRHDYLDEVVFSPRAAIVFKPLPSHSFRLTYNRAFETPSSNNLFLDLEAARLSPFLAVRTVGVPEEGLSFRRDCAGGVANLCMRSGLAPGAGYIPANATAMWDAVVQILQQTQGVDLSGLPRPGPTDVQTVLRLLNPTTQTFTDVSADGVTDIAPLEPTTSDTWEVGYRGLFQNRFLLSLDVYRTRKENFIGPLIVETPSVFFEPTSLAAYLGQFLPAQQAALLAAGIGGISGSAEVRGIPVGTVTPDNPLTASGDLVLTYRNFGELDLWGSDFAAEFILNRRFSLAGTYSWVSKNFFSAEEVGGLTDVALNSPQQKGSVSGVWRDDPWNAELRVRHVDGFDMNSGVYVGTVDSYTPIDATLGYRIPFTRGDATLSVSAQNLFDERHAQFVGAPEIGRMVITRITYTF